MSSRTSSDFGTLGERLRATASTSAVADRIFARHVWLDENTPGLLVRWRRSDNGWRGLVCHLATDTAEPVAEWIPAPRIGMTRVRVPARLQRMRHPAAWGTAWAER